MICICGHGKSDHSLVYRVWAKPPSVDTSCHRHGCDCRTFVLREDDWTDADERFSLIELE